MHFSLIHVSDRPSAWVEEACQLYIKRMPSEFKFSMVAIAPLKRTKNSHIETIRAEEWARIRSKVPSSTRLILLDERGKSYTSKTFSVQVQGWQHSGQNVAFVIAGADGVNPENRREADLCVSLSDMTLPHDMARLFMIEQLYRAWSILANHPYHRT